MTRDLRPKTMTEQKASDSIQAKPEWKKGLPHRSEYRRRRAFGKIDPRAP